MTKSITQKLDYGCGVACFAFVCGMSFDEAVAFLGMKYSVNHGWRPSDLVTALDRFGIATGITMCAKRMILSIR